LEWAIFAPDDVNAFAEVWYRGKRDHSATDHRLMNAVLDPVVQRFGDREGQEQDGFRGQLTAYRNLYASSPRSFPIRTASSKSSMPSFAI
jgi:type I restriction enzyme R subunit